jgi:hypothetical protein
MGGAGVVSIVTILSSGCGGSNDKPKALRNCKPVDTIPIVKYKATANQTILFLVLLPIIKSDIL